MEEYCFATPIGPMTVQSENGYLTALHLKASNQNETKNAVLLEAEKQINEYLTGERHSFDLPRYLKGTDFQKEVWKAVSIIEYGETVSYDDIAVAIGRPKAHRAVGTAVGVNPLPIIIPCHRVIRKDGNIGNYAFGKSLKEELLRNEKKYCKKAV